MKGRYMLQENDTAGLLNMKKLHFVQRQMITIRPSPAPVLKGELAHSSKRVGPD